jgi:hypothetical protein
MIGTRQARRGWNRGRSDGRFYRASPAAREPGSRTSRVPGNGDAPWGGQVSEVDLATILYTSGSTGCPRVATSQRNVWSGPRSSRPILENTSEDRILSALPQLRRRDEPVHHLAAVGRRCTVARSSLPGDLSRPEAARDHGRHRRAAAVALLRAREVHRGTSRSPTCATSPTPGTIPQATWTS